jgi:hypothetical protein
MTRKIFLGLGLLIFTLCYYLVPAAAEGEGTASNPGITVSSEVSFFNEYVWRGMLLDGDAVIQPGVSMSSPESKLGKLTAKFWSSHDLEDTDNRESREYDYILDYTYNFQYADISLGHTYYDFSETNMFSREFYLGAAFPKVITSPSVFVYRDYGRAEDGGGEGTYIVMSAAYSFPVRIKNHSCSLDLYGHYGYNHELFINGAGGDAGMGLGLAVTLIENVTLVPSVNYSIAFRDLRRDDDGGQRERLFTGLTLKCVL